MRKHQTGLSLIELMVSMAITLFILGGVVSSFVSNSTTAEVKREYDNAQDSLRFAASILPRIVRQASDLGEASNGTQLDVRYVGGKNIRDCLGRETETGVVHEDRVYFENGQLWCNDTSLTDGIRQLTFSYGVADGAHEALSPEDYVAMPSADEMTRVRSVRMNFEMDNNVSISITTALRARVLGVTGAIEENKNDH